MITERIPSRSMDTSIEAAGSEGEALFLRIIPQVILKGMEDVEGREARKKNRNRASEVLGECLGHVESHPRAEELPEISTLIREGVPLEVIASLSESFKPDVIVIPHWDSNRMGSFASGDLVSAVKKRTGIPVRVVQESTDRR